MAPRLIVSAGRGISELVGKLCGLPWGLAGLVPVFEEGEAVHMGEGEAVDETDCGGVGGVVATGSGDGWRYL
jgi:hypothetical protein